MRVKRHGRGFAAAACAVAPLVFSVGARADAVLGAQDWDPGPRGWTSEYVRAGLSADAAANTGGWLRLSPADVGAGPGAAWQEAARVAASNLYAGAWLPGLPEQPGFQAREGESNRPQARWESRTNHYTWGRILRSPAAPAGAGHQAPLADRNDWDADPFGSEEQFLADLSAIEWIGPYVGRGGTGAQGGGGDESGFQIPEPAEVSLLAAAIIGSAASMRKRKRRAARR